MHGGLYRFDGFELDTSLCELRLAGKRIPVEPRALDVLHHLIEHRDRVVSKEELLDAVWGDRFVSEAAVTTALRTARMAIGDTGRQQRLIRTVFRRGYQFVGTVEQAPAADGPGTRRDVPLPARLAASSGLGFAGRDHERVVLADAWKDVLASGRRRVVLVSGEAGIGKTTLCSVFAAAKHHEAVVLYGRCDEELSIPYQPWREVLTSLDHHAPDVFAGRREALAPLLGGTGAADLESDSARFAVYSSVVDVLGAVSVRGGPALVVLDDLHWADVQTLALARHLVGRALTTPVLVIGTFRESDFDASHPLAALLAATHREPGVTRLALRGLDDGEVLDLLESVAGHEMDRDGLALRDMLRAETEGNPFFVTEILRHLAETGAVAKRDDGRWTAPDHLRSRGLPVSVREVVVRRVERLGPKTREALDTASVIGRDFELDLLAALLGEDPARTFERLAPAVDNALVTDTAGRFAFTHAIVAHTLYAELSPTARAISHQAVATALERRNDGDTDERAGEIAHHWIHALAPHNRAKAAEYARRAGDYALAHLAPDEAVTWYGQALELLPGGDVTQRCETLVGLGTAQRQAGDPAHRGTLLEAGRLAIGLGHDDLLVRAALANNRGDVSQFAMIDEERVEILRRAIATRPRVSDGALLHAILAIELHGAPDEQVEEAASRALALAREAGDDRVIARAARLAESALRIPDALERRVVLLHEGVAAAERTGDAQLRGMLSMSYEEIALERGDRDAMNREKRIRDSFARRSPEPYVRWTNEQTRSIHFFLDGDLDGAEAAAHAALDIGVATGQPEAFFGYAGQLFQIRRAQDRLAEVAEPIEQIHEENPSLEVFRAGLAYVWCELGRESEARALAEHLDVSSGGAPQFWSTTLMLWAEVCHALALPGSASRLVPVLGRWRGQVASTGATTEGAIAYGLGLALATVGRVEDAADAYDLALTVNHRLWAPLFVARTRLAHAELLAEAEAEAEPDRARSLATEAKTTAAQFGFAHIGRRTEQLLERLS
ncbi:Transcriptional regulatory protein, C terminal [Actinomadura meyerae]|uniref:Transcriptional regulatory protein, C terminal n=1 Tax=Actinomadura meyerae TaxID=240840 RepID=A0A239F314_9ACTN|nr:AAA family ATPase [Actinomadura meyerae]SNS50562.1 Transcriptional regulatory protein, C terminal [Actinomadura meyerae]